MPLISMRCTLIKIDPEAIESQIRGEMQRQMRVAARAFLRAALPRIPVDTGMAAGSLLHLGRLLRVKVPIQPKPNRVAWLNTRHGYKQQRTLDNTKAKYYHSPAWGSSKTPELGERLTTINSKSGQSANLWDVTASRSKGQGKFTFVLNSGVFHLTLNDLHGTSGTGPWGAFEAGRQAFLDHMLNKAKDRMPKLREMLVRGTLRVKNSKMTFQKATNSYDRVKNKRRFYEGSEDQLLDQANAEKDATRMVDLLDFMYPHGFKKKSSDE